jgi:hypothetical protein
MAMNSVGAAMDMVYESTPSVWEIPGIMEQENRNMQKMCRYFTSRFAQ